MHLQLQLTSLLQSLYCSTCGQYSIFVSPGTISCVDKFIFQPNIGSYVLTTWHCLLSSSRINLYSSTYTLILCPCNSFSIVILPISSSPASNWISARDKCHTLQYWLVVAERWFCSMLDTTCGGLPYVSEFVHFALINSSFCVSPSSSPLKSCCCYISAVCSAHRLSCCTSIPAKNSALSVQLSVANGLLSSTCAATLQLPS